MFYVRIQNSISYLSLAVSMSKITVKLVLDTHLPSERDISDEQLATLHAISLSNKSIQYIDNLEAFYNIEKLYLDHNSIKEIENIDFMPHVRSYRSAS